MHERSVMVVRKMRIMVMFFWGLLLSVPAMAFGAEAKITIVSAEAAVDVKVEVWTSPEKWDSVALSVESASELKGRLVLFSGEQFFWFRGTAGESMDVLYVDRDRQVAGILEKVDDDGLHGVCEPVLALLLLPAGFVEQHHIARGNLIVSETVPLQVQTMTNERQQQMQMDAMMKKLARSASKNVRTAHELGECFLSHRKYLDAQKLYERLILRKNNELDAKVGLALTLAGVGKVEDAMKMLLAVIESDSAYVDAYLHLSRMFRRFQKMDAVVATLATGVKKHPEILALRLELAKLYVRSGAFEEAITVLKDVSNASAMDGAKISRVMGDVHLRRGEMSAAAAAYQAYLKQFPYAPHGAELRLFIARHQSIESEKSN